MTSFSSNRLYKLLPAIYRLRDTAEGEPLKALLALFEDELLTIEGDISDLYNNWFIETCAEWAVPYIGDLLDVQEFYAEPSQYGQQERRAYVANTIAYRRRKGTTPVLEQLTQDVTGWRSRAVEFAQLVATTQNLNHIRSNSTTANLRANNQLQQIGTPFEQQAAYTADIRPVSQGGRYNVANIGLFVYRLHSYPINRSTARAVAGSETQVSGRCYTFNPLGEDAPLFNQPQTKNNILTLAEEINLPGILRRVTLANELKQRRQSRLQGKLLAGIRYFDNDPVLQIFVNGKPEPIPPEEILICSLGKTDDQLWQFPSEEFDFDHDDSPLPEKVVAVDPELGRIAFRNKFLPKRVEVSYCYGFSGDIGGGAYSRNNTTKKDLLASLSDSDSLLFGEVEQAKSADANPLRTAVETWNQTVEAWQKLRDCTHIPIAEITLSTSPVTKINSPENIPSRFTPGIKGEGLKVIIDRRSQELILTPGTAIDYQGRQISIAQTQKINLSEIDLSKYPNDTVLLVISYRATPHNQRDLINFVPEAAIDSYVKGTFIPLARLVLNGDRQRIETPDLSVRLKFNPGIVQGLEVEIKPGTLDAVITAGTAVDELGSAIATSNNSRFNLNLYQGKTGYLVLSRHVGLFKQQYQFEFIPDTETAQQPDKTYLILAYLNIPTVEVEVNHVKSIATGIQVNAIGTSVTIEPGTVIDSQGRKIELTRSYEFDLSAYLSLMQMWSTENRQNQKHSELIRQNLVLFISHQKKQGLPIKPVNAKRREWQHIGIVPQEPSNSKTGIILIKDNRTYQGNLTITITATKQLKIIATDGYRPHLQGNIFVEGTANADDPQQGELILEGLLIEGKLTVRPGNLKQLCINHCTLVPQQGGITVEQGALVPPETEEEQGINAIALVTYCLSWLWESICRDTGLKDTNSQLIKPSIDQLKSGISQISQNIQRWQYSPDFNNNNQLGSSGEVPVINGQDNDSLKITLKRTICGAIDLKDTVVKLTIENSIIDTGQFTDEEQPETSGVAMATPAFGIAAFNTDLELKTTTVFGSTIVRTIEASNSIFTEKVTVLRHQNGCIRFSYIPESSQTPRRYQCQPNVLFENELDNGSQLNKNIDKFSLINESLRPIFTSKKYGDPGYAQLGQNCSKEIFTGAEDGAEMGAFNFLKQPQREANLQASLKEYLRVGLQAGIIYIN